MRQIFASVLTVAAVLSSIDVLAQVDRNQVIGWNKTRWGMTEREVLRAAPKAHRANVERAMSRSFHPTLYVCARIDSMRIAGAPFRVDFLLDSATRRLASVETLTECDGDNAVSTFKAVGAYLSKLYGGASSHDTGQAGTKWWLWDFPHTKIFLSDAPLKGSTRHRVSVSYHVNGTPAPAVKGGR